jgi:hypothetical protein
MSPAALLLPQLDSPLDSPVRFRQRDRRFLRPALLGPESNCALRNLAAAADHAQIDHELGPTYGDNRENGFSDAHAVRDVQQRSGALIQALNDVTASVRHDDDRMVMGPLRVLRV